MNTYSIDRLQPLTIGRVGDNGVARIPINCSAWMNKYPELTTFYIKATAPDGTIYIPNTVMENNVLIWNVTETDTAHAGYGEYRVIAEGDDGLQKVSASPPFIVLGTKLPDTQSGGNTGDSDCSCDSDALREEFGALVANAENAANRAEDAASRATDTANTIMETSAVTEEAAERAKDFADDAEESAKSAIDTEARVSDAILLTDASALRAETAAEQAAASAVVAESAADEAESSAQAAKESADIAQGSGSSGNLGNVLVIHGGGAVFPE